MFNPPFDTNFVLAQTHIAYPSLVPEIPLHLLDPESDLGQMTDAAVGHGARRTHR